MTDSNSASEQVIPRLTFTKGYDTELSFPPLQGNNSLASGTDFGSHAECTENVSLEQPELLSQIETRRQLRRSISDTAVTTPSRQRESATSSSHIAVHFKDDDSNSEIESLTKTLTSLHSPCSIAKHYTVSLWAESQSCRHDPDISSTSLQQRPIEQTTPTETGIRQSWQVRRMRSVIDACHHIQPHEVGPSIEQHFSIHRNPNLDLPKVFADLNE